MDFNHSDDRTMLKDMVARFLTDNYALEDRNRSAESADGFSRDMWGQFAELGLIGALFEEKHGGFGGGGFDISVLFEELGRGLVNEPFLASAILAGGMVADLGSVEQRTILADVISGETLMALAHGEPESRYDLAQVTTRATQSDEGWTLDGRKAVALNGDSADVLVITARVSGQDWDEDGISAFLVPASQAGVEIRGYPTIDGLHAAEISLNSVTLDTGTMIGNAGGAYPVIERTVARANVALASEAVGLMDVCRDMTLDYLQTRKQFGVPIGKFQALQHRIATVLMEIEQARSAVINAAGRLDLPRNDRERAVSSAKALAGRVGRLVAEEAIQMHGGIAMTWEYGLGHFAKRLVMIDHQFGDVDYHLERFADLSRSST